MDSPEEIGSKRFTGFVPAMLAPTINANSDGRTHILTALPAERWRLFESSVCRGTSVNKNKKGGRCKPPSSTDPPKPEHSRGCVPATPGSQYFLFAGVECKSGASLRVIRSSNSY